MSYYDLFRGDVAACPGVFGEPGEEDGTTYAEEEDYAEEDKEIDMNDDFYDYQKTGAGIFGMVPAAPNLDEENLAKMAKKDPRYQALMSEGQAEHVLLQSIIENGEPRLEAPEDEDMEISPLQNFGRRLSEAPGDNSEDEEEGQ